MKEVNEDFREVFTYQNFKKTMVENQESKSKIEEMIEKIQDVEAENKEIKTENKEIKTEN